MELVKFLEDLRSRLVEAYQTAGASAQSSILDQPRNENRRSIIVEPINLLPEIPTRQGTVSVEPLRSAPHHVAWASSPQTQVSKGHQAGGTASLASRLKQISISNPHFDGPRDFGRSELSKWNV